MRKSFWLFLIIPLTAIFYFYFNSDNPTQLISPLGVQNPTPTQYYKSYSEYRFDEIAQKQFPKSDIKLEKIFKKESGFTSWLFSYQYNNKTITGRANIPDNKTGRLPVVILIRGYVDDYKYYTGIGTQPAASYFAQNGYITFAPDFLGFGSSDQAAADILEARFQCPEEVIALVNSVKQYPRVNPDQMFFWAHSNGGQIILSVLEITGWQNPTTLWAPVTRGFPHAVLHYMDLENLDEGGLKVKNAIDDFGKVNNYQDFSVDYHFDQLKAPLQVHQGLRDDLIPLEWTDGFVNTIKNSDSRITYFKYPKSNHQLAQDWDLVVERDLNFYKSFY